MNLSFKNVFRKSFLLIGIFVFAFAMFGLANKADAIAVTCTATGGVWSAETTWDDADCGASHAPVAGDIVIIPTGITVSVGATAAAASVDVTGILNIGAFTLTTTTGATVETGGALTIATSGGVLVSPATTIIGTATNNGTLTIATSLSGAGALTNSATGTLNIDFAGAPTITTLTATADGNLVNYRGVAPHCLVTSYDTLYFTGSGAVVCGITTAVDVLLGGTATWTTTSNVTLGTGGTLNIGNGNSVTNAAAYTFIIPSANIGNTGYGTLTNAGTMTITSVAASSTFGTITNTGTMTITAFAGDALAALNNSVGTLYLTGDNMASGNFLILTAGESGTINYNGAAQGFNDGTYYNLTLSGSGVKTPVGTFQVNGNLTISAGTLSLGDEFNTANKLYFGTAYQKKGTWGSSTSTHATHKTSTYFTSGVNGLITVTLGKSTSVQQEETTFTTCASTYTLVNGVCTATATTTAPVTCTLPQVLNTTTNACVTPELIITIIPTVETPGCSAGNAFNTSTGAVCTNNTVLQIPGCGNSATGFSVVDGKSCAGNHVTTTTYNFGTVTLKNGSKGEAVKELQRFLNAKLNLGLVIDGSLGPKTIAVIKQWQKDNGLVSDGLVGAKTKAMMNQ